MPRSTTPLTNTQIDKVNPKDSEYNLADGDGLYLRIKPNGSKLWLLKYSRPHDKKRTNISLGKYPGVSLANARRQRDKARELIANDIDPKEDRDRNLAESQNTLKNTLRDVAHKWIEIKKVMYLLNMRMIYGDHWSCTFFHLWASFRYTKCRLLLP